MPDDVAQPQPSGPVGRAELYRVLGDAGLYRVVDRAQPGTARDHVGLFHQTLVDYVADRVDLVWAHRAIAEALNRLAPAEAHDPQNFRADPVFTYAFEAQAAHWWEAGRPDLVVFTLIAREDVVPRVNLARWTSWADRIAARLGSDHLETLTTRLHLAYWTGETGNAAGALTLFEDLLADMVRALGPLHPHTLSTRGNVAYWVGLLGDAVLALALFEDLLPDRIRIHGTDHPDTLATRCNIARWAGETGDTTRALALSEELLADMIRVLGADHPASQTMRHNIVRWTP